ncbi:hypothetical protein [Phenylobacterium sp.]|uniref:hypothetical protein n=1 Tax=Phenylobacterium sp. TaxID=1871053 RepID=UPI0028109E1C|nr:hypothetical protein [Phenylobacterium sp.]
MSLALATPALAQAPAADPLEEPALDEEGYEVDELVVTAARQVAPRGSVVGEAEPEITLDQREIRALGVSSVAELLTALEPQLASGRGRGGGRPIMLVNGMRISSFSEIRDLPPETIVRTEILPEEVALRYGYRADQRVVNFVLRRRFRALTLEGGVTLPTEGGRSTVDANANTLQIQGDTRTQFDVKAGRTTALLEDERDVVRTDGQDGALRTLLPANRSLALNGVIARPLGDGVAASLNGRVEFTESDARLGPSGDPFLASSELDALRRLTDNREAHVGVAVNGAVSGWRWSFTGNADRTSSRTLTETAFDEETGAFRTPNIARSTVTSADAEVLVNGTLFDLPAGPVNAAFTVGADTLNLESETRRQDLFRSADLDRQSGRAQVNFDAPIASRRRGPIGSLGDLSVNFNAEVRHLSDFGTLTTIGGGITWSPIEAVRIIASITDEDGAPTIQQLGNPEIVTENVRVFDFVTGETVEVTRLEGGNPNLLADNRRVIKLGLTLRPFEETDFVFRADYTRTRIEDEIASFPAITPEIEAAFDDRIDRDAEGRLTRVDVRPVNFDRHERDELRWGFNYSRPLRNTRPPPFAPQRAAAPGGAQTGGAQTGGAAAEGRPAPGEGQRAGGGERQGRGAGFGPGGFGGRRGNFAGGNLQFAAFHTWRLKDEILIRPGVPVLDLLDGSTLGSGSATPKHQLDVQAGVSRNGLGARLNARWQQGGTVQSGLGGSGLTFSDLTTFNLRLFADLGLQPMAREHTWMRGARVSLNVDNLLDERVSVRDAAGATPINYQPDLIDPLGRTVRVSFRKIFLPIRAVPPPGERRPAT